MWARSITYSLDYSSPYVCNVIIPYVCDNATCSGAMIVLMGPLEAKINLKGVVYAKKGALRRFFRWKEMMKT